MSDKEAQKYQQNEDSLPELPKGWTYTKLKDICELINGRAFKPSEWSVKGLPIVRIQNLNDVKADFNYCNFNVEDKYIINNGQLLFAWSGTPGTSFGAHIWKRGKAVLNQHIFKVEINEKFISKKFLMHLLNHNVDEYIRKAHGTAGLAHITKGKFENSYLPLPPLPEQQRIVAKIEELFTKLDAGIEALKKAKEQIKRYRQAVLKYAFEGKLTEQWRARLKQLSPGEYETASVLLEKIKRAKANNHSPTKGKKQKELPPIDTSQLPKLPEDWVWVRLGEVLSLEYGKGLKKDKRVQNGNIPVYGSNGIVGYHTNALVDKPCIVVGRKGASGEVHLSKGPCYPIDTTYYIVPPKEIDISMAYYLLRHLKLRKLDKSTAIPGLNRDDAYNITIPLPPFKEQFQIVSEIERRFSVADEVEKVIDNSLKQAERLRQSILKKAFEGKLVPQDPNDEPAEKLLERITESKGKKSRVAKRNKK